MAESRKPRRRPLSSFALAVAAAIGSTTVVAGPAYAAPDYPSWDEVEQARKNEQLAREKIAEIEGALRTLRAEVAQFERAALERGEQYNVALDALANATDRAELLADQAKRASERAGESSSRAAAVISKLARAGGGDPVLAAFFDENADGDVLARMGLLSKLSEQSARIYEAAVRDRNVAHSLAEQAKLAEQERADAFESAKVALAEAQAAAAAAEAVLAEHETVFERLYAQLAALKGTTAALEREYAEGRDPDPAGGTPGGSTPSNPPSPPGTPVPSPDPTPSSPPSQPEPEPPTVPAPNETKVQGAIAFAKSQLGKPYQFAGTGNPGWDCSGLTKYSYASVGVYIGTHSATNQYTLMKSQGRLVPRDQMRAGDLIWYTSNGGSTMYHVAIYIGGGQMIEAPSPGKHVRIVNVRHGDLWGQAGRPTG